MSNDNTKIAIVVSHQDRIRQFLETKFLYQPIYKPGMVWGESDDKEQKYSLMNGAVLKITYTPREYNKLTIDLIYTGELNVKKPKKDPYLVSGKDPFIKKYTENPYLFNDVYKTTTYDDGYEDNPNDNNKYIIYLVRHGEAIHNQDKGWRKHFRNLYSNYYLDAPLTDIGIEQSQKSAYSIYDDLKKNYINNTQIDNIFASDLYRSRQTLDSICYILNIESNAKSKITTPKIAIIIPCSNEILKSFTSKENIPDPNILENEKEISYPIKDYQNNIERNKERIELFEKYPNKENDGTLLSDKYKITEWNNEIKYNKGQLEALQPKNIDWKTIRIEDYAQGDEDDNGKFKTFISDWNYYNAFFDNKKRNVYTETICKKFIILEFILRIMMGIKRLMPNTYAKENSSSSIIGGKTVKRNNKKYNKRHKKYKTIRKKYNKKITKRKSRRNKNNTRRN